MLILGIDPGSSRIGYGLVQVDKNKFEFVNSGILTIKSSNKGLRLLELEASFVKLLKKFKPQLAVLEKLYFVKNHKTGLEVAQSRGVLTLTIIKNKIPLLEYTPLEIKRAVSGYGFSDKKAIIAVAMKILKIKKIEGGDDAADALAAALTAGFDSRNLLD